MSLPRSEPPVENLGYLTLNDQGAILASGGDLENDEAKAEVIYKLVTLRNNVEPFFGEGCTRLTVVYPHCMYAICLSNKKIYIVKRKPVLEEEEDTHPIETQVSVTNSINS